MASVLMRRGKKSQANLKRGGRPGVTKEMKERAEAVRGIARKLLNDPIYMQRLQARLREGSIQPGVEAMLWYFAHGKPPETIESKVVVPVRIVHEYDKND